MSGFGRLRRSFGRSELGDRFGHRYLLPNGGGDRLRDTGYWAGFDRRTGHRSRRGCRPQVACDELCLFQHARHVGHDGLQGTHRLFARQERDRGGNLGRGFRLRNLRLLWNARQGELFLKRGSFPFPPRRQGRDVESIRFRRSNEVLQLPYEQYLGEDGVGKVLERLDEVDMAQRLLIKVGVAQTGGPIVEWIDLEQAPDEELSFLMVAELVVIRLPQQIESLRKCFITCQAGLEQDEGLADLAAASLQRSQQCLQDRVGRVLLDQLLCVGLGHVRDAQPEVAVCCEKRVLELSGTDGPAVAESEVSEEGVVRGERETLQKREPGFVGALKS